jgi:hypothetical protein
VPILFCARSAFTAWRQSLRGLLPWASLMGAVAAGLGLVIGGGPLSQDPTGVIGLSMALLVPTALFYAVAIRGAEGKGYALNGAALRDGLAVLSGVGVVGFFLALTLIAVNVAANAILFAPFSEELAAAGENQAAVEAVAQRILQENPQGVILTFLLFAGAVLVLTSRLYLAAPASVEASRGRSFETWSWTKGNLFRIVAARLVLLAPAYAAAVVIGSVIAAPVMALAGGGQANAAAFAIGLGVFTFFMALIYQALEAHLSVTLYRGLRPSEPGRPPQP